VHLNSIRIIKYPDTFTPLAVITMHDRVDDCFTQNFLRVLWDIYPFPSLNSRPYRYISVEKRLGSV